MSVASSPDSVAAFADAVRATPRAIAVGAGTKPRLSRVSDDYVRVSTAGLRGIIEYEPSEFTFTALAGTPLKTIVAALAERGQYLPFDPLLVAAGATLGGTVAAGLSGPGRFRFGGLRDFILGVQFVDGAGRLLRMGGKVVKNAAGFDLPKFFVGSVGRFGILTELTFKVFPRPAATRTLRLEAPDAATKARIFTLAGRARWEIDALDAAIEEGAVFARVGGPASALDELGKDILMQNPGSVLTPGDGAYLWQSVIDLRWAHSGGTLVKIALTPAAVADFVALVRVHAGARGWISAGGYAAYLSLPTGVTVPALAWPAITLRGEAPLWPGVKRRAEVMQRIKVALDPSGRFPGMDD